MKTFNGCPIFLLNVDDPESTITTISLVECPAMELPMLCFDKESELIKFSIADEIEHNIISCIIRTDYPIIRVDGEGNPYYVLFNKDTSKTLCQKLMKDGNLQNISLNHNGQLIDGIQLQEVFLKDTSKGINPVGFEEAAEYSLFGIFHVTDDSLWNDCVEGKFGGVSLESYFKLEQFNKENKTNKFSKNMSKLRKALLDVLLKFNSISTDKADLFYDEDSELQVGYKVYVEDESGERIPAPDGEYISDENKIKVEGGEVVEIEKKESEDPIPAEMVEEVVEEVAEPVVEEVVEEVAAPAEEVIDEKERRIAECENKIGELEAKIEELIAKIAEIAVSPAAEPVVEEFEKVSVPSKISKSADKYISIFGNR